jgi:epoxyqueuosine reductase
MSLAEQIKQKALDLGFDAVGITDASPIDNKQIEFLKNWLDSGCAGQMNYMHQNFEKRTNPAKLLENAKSVIVVALNYKPQKPKHGIPAVPTGKVAAFAQYEDYHLFIKKQLRKLTESITSIAGDGLKFKICVDSAPLAERALAQRAGLGFIGRNHMLINPDLGPQILLGEIITDLEPTHDRPIENDCSNCNKCIAACPTGALTSNGQFDANKCISYLTIEYKNSITPESAEKIGDRLFGCDECTLVCPWHQKAPTCKNKNFKFFPERAAPDLNRILKLSKEDFDVIFAESCFKRTGLERLKINAQICLKNKMS